MENNFRKCKRHQCSSTTSQNKDTINVENIVIQAPENQEIIAKQIAYEAFSKAYKSLQQDDE